MADKEERYISITQMVAKENIETEKYRVMPREEAIERMAKANWITVVCLKNKCTPESVSQKEWDAEWNKLSKPYKKVYFAGAEAALNALLEEE